MVSLTSENRASYSDVRISNGAPYSGSLLSRGALHSDVQLNIGAPNSDSQLGDGHSGVDPRSNKRSRKTSVVWKYFTLESVNDNSTRAFCKKCRQSFVYISSNQKPAGTSHLKRHLQQHVARGSFLVGGKKLKNTTLTGNSASSTVGASSGVTFGVGQASGSRGKYLFDRRKDEYILENFTERKGDVGDGQRTSVITGVVETDFRMGKEGMKHEVVYKPKPEIETNGASCIKGCPINRASLEHRKFSFDPECCSHGIMKMIIQHDYPLDMVEHPGFIGFAGAIQPQYKIGSTSFIEEQLVRLYLREKQNLFSTLAGIPGRISLSLDMWSSDQSFGYVILTGQFLDCDWNPQRRILNVIRLPFPDSEVAFNHAVAACLTDWSLQTRLFSLTLNENFATEIVRGNLRGVLSIKNPSILKGQLIIGSCYAHAIGNVAREALASMGPIVEKVRKDVKYVVTSEAHGDNFAKLRQELEVSCLRDLDIDDQTKWNTTYEMLVAASELKDVFFYLDTLDPEYKVNVSVEEWIQVEILILYLKLLHDATRILNAGAYPTADLFFHEACKIKVELMIGALSEDIFVSNLTKPLQEVFDKYWKESNIILAAAVVMDPRFKMKLVEYSFSEIYGEDAEIWIKVIDEGLHELYLEYFEESIPPPPFIDRIVGDAVKTETAPLDNMLSTYDDFLDFDFYIAEIMGRPHSKSELDAYLEESLLPHVEDFNVLDWWRLNSLKYPTLSKMASDLLCTSLSTVLDQDSICDMAERKMDRHRATLKPTVLEALICAKDWLQSGSP